MAAEKEAVPLKNGKLSIFDDFVTAAALEEDGVWRTINGKRFKIARSFNPTHQSILDAIPAATRRAWANGTLPKDEHAALDARVTARGVLRGWDEEYAEPFAYDTAEKLLALAPHLQVEIWAIAADYRNYLAKDAEADAKN